MYTMQRPPFGSLLDFLGPWPWYILFVQPIALLLLWLARLPFTKYTLALPVRQILSKLRLVR